MKNDEIFVEIEPVLPFGSQIQLPEDAITEKDWETIRLALQHYVHWYIGLTITKEQIPNLKDVQMVLEKLQ